MECFHLPCKKPAIEEIKCAKCLVSRYCSERCKKLDLESHSVHCRDHLFSLREFSALERVQVSQLCEILKVQRKGAVYTQKVYLKKELASVVPLKTFYRELAVHKSLENQNIVKLFDFLEDKTRIYLITEEIEGETLLSLIKKSQKIIEKDAWQIFTQICTALDHLHKKSKTHGRLSPENIVLTSASTKLTELSWSPNTQSHNSEILDYTAPEVFSASINTKNDVWSLGVILYEMLHGVLPFKSHSPQEFLRHISEQGFQISTLISKSATKLITDLLQEDPNLRPSILQVLKYQWVQQYSNSKLKRNWQVKHNIFGEGTITDVTGLVLTVQFVDGEEEVTENDLIQEARVIDEYGNIVFDNYIETASKNDDLEEKTNSFIYAVNSKSEKILKSAIRSGRSSRNDSRADSPMVTFDTNVKFEENSRAPSRAGIDLRKGLPPKKPVKYDYDGICIPSEGLTHQRRVSASRSRFLVSFKEKHGN